MISTVFGKTHLHFWPRVGLRQSALQNPSPAVVALAAARGKNGLAVALAATRRFPVKTVADTLS